MNTSIEQTLICDFASKDTTRPHLNSIYFDESGLAVSTDGHRFFATTKMFNAEKAGKIYSADTLLNKNQYKEIEGEYPDLKPIFDTIDLDDYRASFQVEVPEWMLNFKNNKEKVLFTIDYSDNLNPKLVCGSHKDSFCFGIDGRYLAPFSGQKLNIHANNECSPLIITSSEKLKTNLDSSKDNLKQLDWFSLIMPIKLDPVEKTENSKNVIFV